MDAANAGIACFGMTLDHLADDNSVPTSIYDDLLPKIGLILALKPDGFLSGLPTNLGSIEFGVDDPNWLAALPTLLRV